MPAIDLPPIDTPLPVIGGLISFLGIQRWALWFQQIYNALTRPTLTVSVLFTSTPSQSSQDFIVQFPAGTVPENIACIAACAPLPPANSSFSYHVTSGDRVVIRFNNYSSGPLGTGLAQFFTLTVFT